MRYLFILFLIAFSSLLFGQSKSISRFRASYKENSSVFFYSSTLKMLNPDNNPEISRLIDGIEEIRILNYQKQEQKFNKENISGLIDALKDEKYNNLMTINENGNQINLYSREKGDKMYGMVAIVENIESLIIIDLVGSIDIKKFLELKRKLEGHINFNS